MRLGSTEEVLTSGSADRVFEALLKSEVMGARTDVSVLQKITVQEDIASSPVFTNNEDSEMAAHFVRENSSWKIDLGESLDESGQLLKKLGAEQNLTERDIVKTCLTGYFPQDEVTAGRSSLLPVALSQTPGADDLRPAVSRNAVRSP